MHKLLGNPIEQLVDGENNRVQYDYAYPVKSDLVAAVSQLRQMHGEDIYLLPISGASAGGGIFQYQQRPGGSIIGLRFDPPLQPRLRFDSRVQLTEIELDEIVIDRERQQICAGAAITLDQLNRALVEQLGHSYKVAGADLTSYQYAAVGATFMTGGMGPQRRYFSDSVVEIALYDGATLASISGEALQGYAGTYGWSGIVCAVRCNYHRFADNEIGFALPVSGQAARLSRLLDHLSPWTFLSLDCAQVDSLAGANDLILGIEHVSLDSMQPLLQQKNENPAQRRALELTEKCIAADADGLVFINAYSDRSSDDFLIDLADDQDADVFTIAGIELEHAEIFNDPEEMRAVREAIPYAARTQAPSGKLVYKSHSDANIRLAPGCVAIAAERIWQINCEYIDKVEHHFAENSDIDGQILVYGHLNPFGIDPHNRVTLSSDSETAFRRSCDFLRAQRAEFYCALAALCVSADAIFIGGEKTADSELGIYQAFGGPEHAPAALFARFRQQRATVSASAAMFNWRAPQLYR